ncbi:hypothetical protein WJX81_007246 [Elliptochloris bilobata]|uniref:Exostosin GT47 domain-containing protein n=1 Tax=Elliptochloris bilobata TaxID=381761 RepID=A0AAW1RMN4_9CHLO
MYSGAAFDWVKNCTVEHSEDIREHRHQLHGGEILFQERLENHPERVFDENWQRAEIFAVPALLVFAWWRKWSPTPSCNGLSFTEQLNATGEALLASPYFRNKGGRDHLIVADSYASNYMPWRCTISVPYVHKPNAHTNERHTLNIGDKVPRDKGVFFMGLMDAREAYLTRRQVAKKILPMAELNMTFISTVRDGDKYNAHFPEECDVDACLDAPRCANCSLLNAANYNLYEHRLERSQFSLMIKGDSPSSQRLYDSLAYGTIPVIISNRLWHTGMPFPGKVPWQDLVYSLEENFTIDEFKQVMATPMDTIIRKRELIRMYFKDVSWTVPGSRVVDNILEETLRYCL